MRANKYLVEGIYNAFCVYCGTAVAYPEDVTEEEGEAWGRQERVWEESFTDRMYTVMPYAMNMQEFDREFHGDYLTDEEIEANLERHRQIQADLDRMNMPFILEMADLDKRTLEAYLREKSNLNL